MTCVCPPGCEFHTGYCDQKATAVITIDGQQFKVCAECKPARRRSRPYAGKRFSRSPCKICGRMISNCGFASFNHDIMHEKKGERL